MDLTRTKPLASPQSATVGTVVPFEAEDAEIGVFTVNAQPVAANNSLVVVNVQPVEENQIDTPLSLKEKTKKAIGEIIKETEYILTGFSFPLALAVLINEYYQSHIESINWASFALNGTLALKNGYSLWRHHQGYHSNKFLENKIGCASFFVATLSTASILFGDYYLPAMNFWNINGIINTIFTFFSSVYILELSPYILEILAYALIPM